MGKRRDLINALKDRFGIITKSRQTVATLERKIKAAERRLGGPDGV
ncbi:MAG: hypothetical protein IIC26_06080 [Chloroflexi bacterium]|nr:hypothetical protein [Chloroflexota bacterium]